MPAIVYGLPALSTPPIIVPAAALDPTASPAPPLSYAAFTVGQTGGTVLSLNQNSRRAEIAHQHGGSGAYATLQGLDLSAGTGLSLTIAVGAANVDGPQVKAAAASLALSDNTYSWVWISSANVISAVASANPSVIPAAPAAAACFLGRVRTLGGSIQEIDYSGRLFQRGGMLWRQTADLAQPLDTPPVSLQLHSRTLAGVYFWDGIGWTQLAASTAALTTSVTNLQADVDDLGQTLRRMILFFYLETGLDLPPELEESFSRAVTEFP